MADIAARAGLSTGNTYRYFRGKAALFAAVLDPAFVERFDALLGSRLDTLSALPDPRHLDPAARDAQQALLDFWVRHRLRVIILLDRCEGTPHAAFGERFVDRLVDRTAAYLHAQGSGELPPSAELVLRQIFDNTRRTLVGLLEAHRDPVALQEAFALFWSFQLAGLAGFEAEVLR